jgi:hypothetical protein
VPLRLLPVSRRSRMRFEAAMKSTWSSISSMVVCWIVVIIGLAMPAVSPGQETAPDGKATNTVAGEAAKLRRAQLPFAKGVLQANDLLRRLLKLKTEDGVRTFAYTEHTYIFRGKEKITPDKLVVGETIALKFYTDKEGRVLVYRIKAYGTIQSAGTKSIDAIEPAR